MICKVVKNVRLFRVCRRDLLMRRLCAEMILSVDRFR